MASYGWKGGNSKQKQKRLEGSHWQSMQGSQRLQHLHYEKNTHACTYEQTEENGVFLFYQVLLVLIKAVWGLERTSTYMLPV